MAAGGPTRGVDDHYESPAAGPKHQRCTKDHAVKIILIWNRKGSASDILGQAKAVLSGTVEPEERHSA